MLVVGGGDSALEAATSVSGEPGTVTTLSYRGEAFTRAKVKNRNKVEQAAAAGRLNVLLKSNVKRIAERALQIEQAEKRIVLRNDAVIINAGGVLPTPFLERVGIAVETKYGTP